MKNLKNNKKEKDILKNIEQTIDKRLRGDRTAINKHPILFGFLGTFGLVSTVVGLEGIIAQIPYLYNNPYILTSVGILILFLTGAMYRLLES